MVPHEHMRADVMAQGDYRHGGLPADVGQAAGDTGVTQGFYEMLGKDQLTALLSFRDSHIEYLQKRIASLHHDQEALQSHVENLTCEREVLRSSLQNHWSLFMSAAVEDPSSSGQRNDQGRPQGSAAGARVPGNYSAATGSAVDAGYGTPASQGVDINRFFMLEKRLSKTRMWRGPDAQQRVKAALLMLESPKLDGAKSACVGTYEITSAVFNDYPVWKQRGGNHQMFGSGDGVLVIDLGKEVNEDLEQRRGIVRSAGFHEGLMPHEVGSLQYLVAGKWVEDPSLVIRVHPAGSSHSSAVANIERTSSVP